MAHPRLLFVDDEPNIRLTLPAILRMHGFEVTVTATVAEALAAIHSESYDVLLADLNIGQPGDGFTVVSAMRRTQPDAITLIITGYPAFDSALEAIRKQVDDYIVKPAEAEHLVDIIREKLITRRGHQPVPIRRVFTVLREQRDEIVAEWLRMVNESPELAAIPLSREERVNHLPMVLDELADSATRHPGELSEPAREQAARHGRTRRLQGYSVLMMVDEFRLVRISIGSIVRNHLLSLDVSHLITDLISIGDSLDQQMLESVRAFLRGEVSPIAA